MVRRCSRQIQSSGLHCDMTKVAKSAIGPSRSTPSESTGTISKEQKVKLGSSSLLAIDLRCHRSLLSVCTSGLKALFRFMRLEQAGQRFLIATLARECRRRVDADFASICTDLTCLYHSAHISVSLEFAGREHTISTSKFSITPLATEQVDEPMCLGAVYGLKMLNNGPRAEEAEDLS